MLPQQITLEQLVAMTHPHGTMTLQELREALNIQQRELGKKLGIKQAAVSRMERRSGMQIGHLRKAVEAMGGKLVITAHFPNMDIHLNT